MKLVLVFILTCLGQQLTAQNIGIGTSTPQKKLTVNGSVMVDAENKSMGALDSAALLFGNTGKVGIAADKNGLNNGGLDIYTNGQPRISINSAGQVKINAQAINAYGFSIVAGGLSKIERISSQTIGISDSLLVGNNLLRALDPGNEPGIVRIGDNLLGHTHKLQVNGGLVVDGSSTILQDRTEIGVDVADGDYGLLVWSDAYVDGDVTMAGTNPTLQFKQGAIDNKGFLQLSGDNIRIGTNSGNSAGKFIIRNNGGDRVSVDGSGNMAVQGELTVSGDKGVMYNSQGSGSLKYFTRTAAFGALLGGHALSAEGSISFPAGIFSSPPKVFAGDIVSTGGTAGELYRVQLVLYGATTTSCKVRLLNTSPNPVNYNVTYNIVCLGE